MHNFWIDYTLFIVLLGGFGLYIYYVFGVIAPSTFYDERTGRQVSVVFKSLGAVIMLGSVVVPPVSEFILKG